MDVLYLALTIALFLALAATVDLIPAGRSAARAAMRAALERGEIDEERYAAGLRALNETA